MLHSIYIKLKNTNLWKKHLKNTAFGDKIRQARQRINKSKLISTNFKLENIIDGQLIDNYICTEPVDVIVPIYNGYEFLVKLFEDLPKTDVPCRFILVDDCSPDERISEIIKKFEKKYSNTIVIRQRENGGFVKSVNAALSVATNHVALVNTDTELPSKWLERLMYPIFTDTTVATTTPYTNSGTICSFPNIGENNKIYSKLSVDELDSYFAKLPARYVELPTGVGFCMGMNKEAIKKVGVLDEEHFGKGYGEENDWCLRAIKAGFRNVQVENLFVYHKHGGSFVSEEKERLINEHLEYLNNKYPKYGRSVANFMAEDTNKAIRKFVQMCADTHINKSVLYFDHSLGGGATEYLNKQKAKLLQDGACVTVIRYNHIKNCYSVFFESGFENEKRFCLTFEKESIFDFKDFSYIFELVKYVNYDEIYINELVTFPNLFETFDSIISLKECQNAKLVMLYHDFFSFCPAITLMDEKGVFCDVPDYESCNACFVGRGYNNEYKCEDINEWRTKWSCFFEKCDEVRCFSTDTRNRAEKLFDASKIQFTTVPHVVDYMYQIKKDFKTTKTINIGLLGAMAKHKGSDFITSMMDVVEKENLNIKFKLIGFCDGVEIKGHSSFSMTGKYHFGELPKLIFDNDIDVFFICSVWPETFSYTTEEIIKMGVPVVCFDMGAPAERVAVYEKGLVLKTNTAKDVLNEILAFEKSLEEKGYSRKIQEKKTAFYTDFISYSSRYRAEHFAEELLFKGKRVELWNDDNLKRNINWSEYERLVVYRSSYKDNAKRIIDEAHANGIKVIFDIDDLVYDYNYVSMNEAIDKNEYNKDYCDSLKQSMEKADALTTSTNCLSDIIKKSFPNKPIFVNRNEVSSEMYILSNIALKNKLKQEDKFILGYFSGSNTHNRDFEVIKDVLKEFMLNHENTILFVVGCIDIPNDIKKLNERIVQVPFVDWRDLPEVISIVDVNLMPLEDTIFHKCKSEIKWTESAMLKVPTVATRNEEIAAVTIDKDNIILCDTTNDWKNALETLYCDTDCRNKIAENAYAYVSQRRTTFVKDCGLLEFVEGIK